MLAIALLIGFYALAAVVILLLVSVNLAVIRLTGRTYGYLVIGSALVVLGVLRGVFAIRRDGPPPGLRVGRDDEPQLWQLVDEVASSMATRPPDELLLIPDVNAFVYEDSALLGLIPRHRGMAIGVPVLNVLGVDQLRAVLAHEFGHYVGGDTRLGHVTHRGRLSLVRTLQHLDPQGWTHRVFAAYTRMYLRVSSGVFRQQELAADLAAARLASRDAAITALTEVDVAQAAFSFFVQRYLTPVWQRGRTPDNIYAGLRGFSDHPQRRQELSEVRSGVTAPTAESPFDTHPPTPVRVSRLQRLRQDGRDVDSTPARALLRDPDQTERRVSRWWATQMIGADVESMDWGAVANEVYGPMVRTEAARLLAAVATVDRGTSPADIHRLCEVLERGGGHQVGAQYAGGLTDVPEPERHPVAAAALHSGVVAAQAAAIADQPGARWALSWVGPAAVVTPGGEQLDVDTWVSPAEVDMRRLSRLRTIVDELGIDPGWRPVGARDDAPAEQPAVVGALFNLTVGGLLKGRRSDAVLLGDGLLLVRNRTSGLDRVTADLSAVTGGSLSARAAVRRVEQIVERPLDLVLAEDPENRYVPWTAVARLGLAWRPYSWRLDVHLHDGESLTVRPVARLQSRRDVQRLLVAAAPGLLT